jgi:gamma-glutamylcyclotransferase (GGCT)/AIG2-like uncharacterized protein YtfP
VIESFITQKSGKKEHIIDLIKNDTRVSQELFGLKKGEYAFFVENETGFVITLTDINERHLPTLDTIKEVVKGDLMEERAHTRMANRVQEAKDAAATLSLNEVQKQFGGVLSHTDMIQPTDNKKVQELDKKELPARTMLGLDKVGSILVHNGERTSALIKLDAIEQYNENMPLDGYNEVKNNLEGMRAKFELEGFVASLHRNATIETNESILIAGEEYSE